MDPLNAEFLRLLEKSGWSQSEAARRLRLSAGVVSRYLSEETRPSKTVLQGFKLLIGDARPLPGESEPVGNTLREGPPMLDGLESELLNRLRELEPETRRQLIAQFIQFVSTMRAQKVTYVIPKKSA